MKPSTICLISGIICFIAGAAIFILALFTKTLEPKSAGAVGSILIVLFLFLSMGTIVLKNKERAQEEK